jgi:hypothetical protein
MSESLFSRKIRMVTSLARRKTPVYISACLGVRQWTNDTDEVLTFDSGHTKCIYEVVCKPEWHSLGDFECSALFNVHDVRTQRGQSGS